MINIPKGTKDVLPAESYKWHYVENTAREIADLYCLNEIRTPTFEHTELFLRGVGETTDVVNKEMYAHFSKGIPSAFKLGSSASPAPVSKRNVFPSFSRRSESPNSEMQEGCCPSSTTTVIFISQIILPNPDLPEVRELRQLSLPARRSGC